jgi:hypothetical protein
VLLLASGVIFVHSKSQQILSYRLTPAYNRSQAGSEIEYAKETSDQTSYATETGKCEYCTEKALRFSQSTSRYGKTVHHDIPAK